MSGAIPSGIAVIQRFFSFLVPFFLFSSQEKRKNEQKKKLYVNISFRYLTIILIMYLNIIRLDYDVFILIKYNTFERRYKITEVYS